MHTRRLRTQTPITRIQELEDELRRIDPGNKLLNVIEYT